MMMVIRRMIKNGIMSSIGMPQTDPYVKWRHMGFGDSSAVFKERNGRINLLTLH
jgi:hypothetical protein